MRVFRILAAQLGRWLHASRAGRRPIRRRPLLGVMALAVVVAGASGGLGILLRSRHAPDTTGPSASAIGAATAAATAPSSLPGTPSPREGAAMAYDPATRTVILFGGDDGQEALGGTWSWDGSGWAQLSPVVSPPARTRAMMAYDPVTRRLVLTGGYGMSGGGMAASGDTDTWTWDGSTWSPQPAGELPASAPAPRSAALATDDGRSQLILVTGLGAGGCQAVGTWSWSGASWVQLHPATSPSAADSGLLADDPTAGTLDLVTASVGGCPGADQGGMPTSLWSWDGSDWAAEGGMSGDTAATSPKMVLSGALVASATGPLLVVWSGTYAWEGAAGWRGLAAAPGSLDAIGDPAEELQRQGEALAYDEAFREVVLFGGECLLCDADGPVYLSDTWTWDGSWTESGPGSEITPTPTPAPTPTPSPVLCATPSPGTADLLDNLHMVSATTGWAQENGDGTILHTTTAGHQWSVASPPLAAGQQMVAASFLDADTAEAVAGTEWNCLNMGPPSADLVAWATRDGGVTWTRQGSFDVPSLDGGTLDFVDPQDGWLSVGGGGAAGSSEMALYRTVDGGALWQEVASTDLQSAASPGAAGSLPAGFYVGPAAFISATTGWITGSTAGQGPEFYVTHDGGITWSTQALPDAAGFFQPATETPQFWSSQGGWMLVRNPASSGSLLYLTTDAGTTWSPVDMPGTGQLPEGADFIDADDGWLLTFTQASDGSVATQTLWVTHDGGATWAAVSGDTELTGVDFANLEDGWATTTAPNGAAGPPLLETTDGGSTWTARIPEVSG